MTDYEQYTDIGLAIEYLKSCLKKGTLSLFLGAGASRGLGLPDWVMYVNSVRSEFGLTPISDTANADQLQIAADEIRRKSRSNQQYFSILKKCLYQGVPELTPEILQNKLLISLGALLMSSTRGRISRVVTLNYDSMLEWYLRLHGYVVRVVYQLPQVEGDEDVRIYHPHGFLPHPSLNLDDSNFIILDFKQANERLGTGNNPWHEMTRHILRTSVCLFVGMSLRTLDDRLLAPLLVSVGNEVNPGRPTGFWLTNNDVFNEKKDHFLDMNVVPIPYSDLNFIPNILLEICQKAALDILIRSP